MRPVVENSLAVNGSWLWDVPPLKRALDAVQQQLEAVNAWLAASGDDNGSSTLNVRHAHVRHRIVHSRFIRLLTNLESPWTPEEQRPRLQRDLKRTGQELCGLIATVEDELPFLRLAPPPGAGLT
jgi:hypothetical protein